MAFTPAPKLSESRAAELALTRPWTKLYSEWVPAELPAPSAALIDRFEATAKASPDAPAVYYFDRTISYGELDDLASRFATLLASWGIGHGDRVGLYMQNVPQYLIALYGTWKRGAAVVPLNPMFKESELTYHLQDSGARVLVALESLYEGVAKKVLAGGTTVEKVITTSELDLLAPGDVPAPCAASKKLRFAETLDLMETLATTKADPAARLPVKPEALASLGYTSGTTGQPKGAMTTQGNMAYNSEVYRVWMKLGPEDVILGIAPLFHITGMVGHIGAAAVTGCPCILAFRFDAEATWKLVERYKPTMTVGSITVYVALMNHPGETAHLLGSMTKAFSGGAPIAPSLADRFEQKYGVYIHNIYGLTESTSPTHAVPLGARSPVDPVSGALSVGIPIPGCEVRLMGLEDNSQPAEGSEKGEAGEIASKGEMIFVGYWNKKEATEKAFANGFFLTGDVATRTADDYYFVVDRKKDMINVSGYKVWPREVEDYLYKHPAVREAAVVGVADEYRGETVKAFVALKPDQIGKVSENDIIEFCKTTMAAYKYPRLVEIVPEIPKTVTGKMLRRVLRDKHEAEAKAKSNAAKV